MLIKKAAQAEAKNAGQSTPWIKTRRVRSRVGAKVMKEMDQWRSKVALVCLCTIIVFYPFAALLLRV